MIDVSTLEFNDMQGDGLSPGLWDNLGITYGLFAVSMGDNGGDAVEQEIGGGDGGAGGTGLAATAVNNGSVTLTADGSLASDSSRSGVVAVYAASVGGNGGDDDPTDGGDPHGGDSGEAGFVTANNFGTIEIGQSTNSVGFAAGIYAESVSGVGGKQAAGGGTVGKIGIRNTGDITVAPGASVSRPVWGIYGNSLGGYAYIASTTGQNDAGSGGAGKVVNATHSGSILVTADGVPEPTTTDIDRGGNSLQLPSEAPSFLTQAGGIVLATVGGDGAETDSQNRNGGGNGGGAGTFNNSGSFFDDNGNRAYSSIALAPGSSVGVSGDNILGVGLFGQGGDGGPGIGQSSGGGNGGNGRLPAG